MPSRPEGHISYGFSLQGILAEVHEVRHPYVKPTTKKFITFFEVFRAAS